MTNQNQQAQLPPLDVTEEDQEAAEQCDSYCLEQTEEIERRLCRERQLLQALRERDEAWKEVNATKFLYSQHRQDARDAFQEYESALAAANKKIEEFGDQFQANVQLSQFNAELLAALAAANRRADEAFNEGVEAAANDIETESDPELEDIMQSVRANIRNLKRPTQPEQTQKEQGR